MPGPVVQLETPMRTCWSPCLYVSGPPLSDYEKKQNIKINIRINISIYQFIKVSVIRVNINRFGFLGHIVLTSHVPLLPCCLTPAHNMLKGRGQLRLSNQSIIHYKKYVRYNIYISHENNIKSSVQYRFLDAKHLYW